MAATRISKNSSRLLAEMDRNFKRSRSGLPSSDASSSTRRLNASQEVSRFKKYWGLSSEIRAMTNTCRYSCDFFWSIHPGYTHEVYGTFSIKHCTIEPPALDSSQAARRL